MSATRRMTTGPEIDVWGRFVRQPSLFDARITADGSSGYPAEPGRYHIYVCHACPWASRAVIVRRLKGLEDVVTMSAVDPIRDERGWAFRDGPGYSRDPINDFSFLSEAYLATDPTYDRRPTVPAVWDKKTNKLISNDYQTITLDLATQFKAYAGNDIDLYPEALRPDIDRVNAIVYDTINNGVYKAGFAQRQEAYEEAVTALFGSLDDLDRELATQRYLVGEQLTEADIRLFTTLVRFDAVYHYHFKCNIRRLTDYDELWAYARDLFQTRGIGDTVEFETIKRHYYMTHPHINPNRIMPLGPMVDWSEPSGRDSTR
jgi:glutathionyl-hydroquinone reductase